MQCVRHCHSKDPKKVQHFEQPVLQTAQMFIGEMGCWLVVTAYSLYGGYSARRGKRSVPYRPIGVAADVADSEDDELGLRSSQEAAAPIVKALVPNSDTRQPLRGSWVFLLALPACCDIAGTTLMNVGLLFVAASIYQMTRGALVLFVGLFSVLFLGRHLRLYQWSALVLVMLGVALVGLAGAIFKDHKAVPSATDVHASAMLLVRGLKVTARKPDTLRTVIGILLIAGAQIFTASQFVLEEWILEHFALEPLKVVGWEGIFGFAATLMGMIIMHLAVGKTDSGRYGYFDAKEGWRELTQNRAIAVSSVLIMISIGSVSTTNSPWWLLLTWLNKQGIQLLRSLRHPYRQCNLPVDDRYLPNAVHMDSLPGSGLGDIQVASSTWICALGLWHFSVS